MTFCLALSSVAVAAPPSATPAAGAGQAQPDEQPQDDSLFEFLGSDDVEDPHLWDYLLKKVQHSQPPPQAPAQDAGK